MAARSDLDAAPRTRRAAPHGLRNASRRLAALLLASSALVAVACGPVDPSMEIEAAEEGLRVPGRWSPPPDVIARANMQRVPVVDPPPVYPDGSCSGPDPLRDYCTHPACIAAHPGTAEIAAWIMAEFQAPVGRPEDRISNLGVAGCRRNTNSPAYLSVHAIGRAIDIGVTLSSGDANNTAGDALANFLIEHAEHIGIQRVGWDGRWFNGERGFGATMCSSRCNDSNYPYACWPCNPHVDHLHIEVSLDAAARRTRFFTEGPPGEVCPLVCYGNAAVAADCSWVNCEDTGQVCRPDPVRCVPDEPPLASHHPAAARATLEPMGTPSRWTFVGPTRVFDTRTAGADARLARSGTGILSADAVGRVTTWPDLPAGARGVWLNSAVVSPEGAGFLQVFPSGPAPGTSSLNYQAGSVRSNAAPVLFGSEGGVDFVPRVAATHLVTDLVGAFTASGAGLRSVAPRRVIDTRARGAMIPAMAPYRIRIPPPSDVDATGIVASVAVINSEPGHLRIYACDEPPPETSSINYEGRGVVANTVVSRLSSDDELCVWARNPVHVIVDVTGFFVAEGELSYHAVRPTRLLDTRAADALYRGRLGAGQTVEIPIQSLPGAPAGMQSVVVNLTTTDQDGPGFVTIWPCGSDADITSALNYDATRGAVGTVALSSLGDGSLCLRSFARTHLIVDLLGAWVPTPGGPAPSPSEPPVDPDPDLPGEEPEGEADAGPDAPRADASTPWPDAGASATRDAGETIPTDDGGCSCRAAGSARSGVGSWLLLGLLGLGLLARRQRLAARSSAASS